MCCLLAPVLCPVGNDACGVISIEDPMREIQCQEKKSVVDASHLHIYALVPYVPSRILSDVPQKPSGKAKAPVLAATPLAPDIIIIVEQTLTPAVSTHRRWMILPSSSRAILECVCAVMREKVRM